MPYHLGRGIRSNAGEKSSVEYQTQAHKEPRHSVNIKPALQPAGTHSLSKLLLG